MKTIPIASHYALPQTSIARCLLLTKQEPDESDPTVLAAVTSLDQPLTVDGVLYQASMEFGDIVSTSSLAVDNMELTIIPDGAQVLEADLLAGRWDGADFSIFEVNFRSLSSGVNLLKRGKTGNVKLSNGSWSIELRSLKQALQQQATVVTSKTCRYRLFSTAMPDGLCFVDPGPFTFDGTVTGVASQRELTDTGLTQDDAYFQDGSIRFVDGDNAGYERKVKTFAAGVITMTTPFPFEIQVGDTFIIQAGCQKRLTEDCIGKFDNVLNFGGEPHIVGTDSLTKDPEPPEGG